MPSIAPAAAGAEGKRPPRKNEKEPETPDRMIRGLKLSTKCRQLEKPKRELLKKFPFWYDWNVKGESHPPSQSPILDRLLLRMGFIYSLRGTENSVPLKIRQTFQKMNSIGAW